MVTADECVELVEDDGGWCSVCGDLFERGQEVSVCDGERRHADDLPIGDCLQSDTVSQAS